VFEASWSITVLLGSAGSSASLGPRAGGNQDLPIRPFDNDQPARLLVSGVAA
jgi:hypothetical protein